MTKKKPGKPKKKIKKGEMYEIEGDKASKKRNECPKCGSGNFLAKHADREHCGRCGYTKWEKQSA